MKEPALGMIEFKSVARGILAADAMIKKAPIKIIGTHPICPGKYMVLICGEVADVEESMAEGVRVAGDLLVNDLFLPNVHSSIIPAISGNNDVHEYGAVGIVEAFSVASCVVAADIAAKEAPVVILEIRLANGLGGKGYFLFSGKLHDVEASMSVAKKHISSEGMLAAAEIIAAPHKDIMQNGIYW